MVVGLINGFVMREYKNIKQAHILINGLLTNNNTIDIIIKKNGKRC